ncbi:hypothetical protein C6A85_67235, partial [Mycobacterium sp. ITM-2017-0098]
PATTFVAGFLGDPLLLEGSIATAGTLQCPGVAVTVGPSVPLGTHHGGRLAERLRLLGADLGHCYDNGLPGEVLFSSFDGQGTFYQVRLDCGP